MKQKQHLNTFTMVLRTITVNKKRSFFAVIGIIVGIAAVSTLASLGYSSQQKLADELKKLGTNMLIIEAAWPLHNRSRQAPTAMILTENDITVLEDKIEGIAAIAPVLLQYGVVENNNIATRTNVIATRPPFMQIRAMNASLGRFFSDAEDAEGQTVILLGQTVATRLFKDTDPVGKTVKLNDTAFMVIGVLAEKGIDADDEDQDDLVIIPLTTAQQHGIHGNQEYLTSIYIEAEQAEIIPELKEKIVPVLRANHQLDSDDPDHFNVIDQTQLLAAQADILGSLDGLVNVLAIITLLAGGLGISAVQLISIRERIWEIGLHRAVGARKKDIAIQFILESALLGGVGGLLGAAIGVLVPLTVASAFSLTPAIAWPVLFLSLIVSIMIGISAGIYPALYASRLNPVAALRSN